MSTHIQNHTDNTALQNSVTCNEDGSIDITPASGQAVNVAGQLIASAALAAKASGAEIITGTNDTKFATPKALADAGVPNLGANGGVAFDRLPKCAVKALTGAGLHAAVQAWQNPEAVSIIITKVIVDVTTVATGAAKVDVGTTAVSATTASDNLIDGIDVNAAAGLLGQADGDGTTNSKLQQKLATGKWVTFKEISGDVTGLVANAYIFYVLV